MSELLELLITSQEDPEKKEALLNELQKFKQLIENEQQLKSKKMISMSVEELVKWNNKSNELKKQISSLNTDKENVQQVLEEFEKQKQIEHESYEAKIKRLETMLDENMIKATQYYNQNIEQNHHSEQIEKDFQDLKNEVIILREQNREVFTQQQKLLEKENQIQEYKQKIEMKNKLIGQNEKQSEIIKNLEKEKEEFQTQIKLLEEQQIQSDDKIKSQQQKHVYLENKIFQKEEYVIQLNEINKLQKKNEEVLRDDAKYQQTQLEETQNEIIVLQKKFKHEIIEIKQQLQKEKDNNQFILEEKQKHERDLYNIMQKRQSNSGIVDKHEKVIVETMSNQIYENQIEINRLTKKIGTLQKQVESYDDKIEMKNKILQQIIVELYKNKPSLAESVDHGIDDDDYIFIETTQNIKNSMEQYEIVERCLLENLRLKQEIQKLCHEMNNHYAYNKPE